MDILAETSIKLGKKKTKLKLTTRALYNIQKELGFDGLLSLVQTLEKADLVTTVSVIKHCSNGELDDDDILDHNIDIIRIIRWLSEGLQPLFSNDVVEEDAAEPKK
jgi:hypothetical protein